MFEIEVVDSALLSVNTSLRCGQCSNANSLVLLYVLLTFLTRQSGGGERERDDAINQSADP